MPYKPRDIEEKLQSKFAFEGPFEGDHRYYQLKLDGLPLIVTYFSHNKKEIGSLLESKIMKQLRVRKQFFTGMIDCTNSREDYYDQVRKDPYPPFQDHLLKRP